MGQKVQMLGSEVRTIAGAHTVWYGSTALCWRTKCMYFRHEAAMERRNEECWWSQHRYRGTCWWVGWCSFTCEIAIDRLDFISR